MLLQSLRNHFNLNMILVQYWPYAELTNGEGVFVGR